MIAFPTMPFRTRAWMFGCALGSTAVFPTACLAAAATDGSVGPRQSLSGHFAVPQGLGTTKGPILFHSFSRFSIGRDESATFTVTDPAVRNVIGRVTGGEMSTIEGPLKVDSTAGTRPDFLLVNPSGIVVGPGGRFDVPAGLHLSTAHKLVFGDGYTWDTRTANPSSLTVAPLASFGFFDGKAQAALTIHGTDIRLAPQNRVEFSAGAVTFDDARVQVPGGHILVNAARQVEIIDGAQLDTTSSTAGRAGQVTIDAGSLTVRGRGENTFTGIYVSRTSGAPTPADVDIRVAGPMTVTRGAQITSDNESSDPGGRVRVRAGSLAIDGEGAATGILSHSLGNGRGADVVLEIDRSLTLRDGAWVRTFSRSDGIGGAITVNAESLKVDGSGARDTMIEASAPSGNGGSGSVSVAVRGAAELVDGGSIRSMAEVATTVGAVTVRAGSISLDDHMLTNATELTTKSNRGAVAGAVDVDAAGPVAVRNGARIGSDNFFSGRAGDVRVKGTTITVGGQFSELASTAFGTGSAGVVRVEASERIDVVGSALVASEVYGSGTTSRVEIRAPVLEVRGSGNSRDITTVSTGRDGVIDIEVGRVLVSAGAHVRALTNNGNAGAIEIRAESVYVDGQGVLTSIGTEAERGSAGILRILARDEVVIRNGGALTAWGGGRTARPGAIEIATDRLTVDGRGTPTLTLIGGESIGATTGATIDIRARQVELLEGHILSTTVLAPSSHAGSVTITAGAVRVVGGSDERPASIRTATYGAGNAGDITIRASTLEVVDFGEIVASTLDAGRGGSIDIQARRVDLDRSGLIFTGALDSGDAGSIEVRASESMRLNDAGRMIAGTAGAGAAGRITVDAGRLTIGGFYEPAQSRSGLASRANEGSGGQAGSISVTVRERLLMEPNAGISIANDAKVPAGVKTARATLTVVAGELSMQDAFITAASTANADAGTVSISSSGPIRLDNSRISTAAVDGNGGPVNVQAGRTLRLRDSQISTSVSGRTAGNGGDIDIKAQALLLESGFVQANTVAPLARGGDVRIAVGALLPNGGNAFVGGDSERTMRAGVAGLNVIQAAAPSGVSGTLDVTSPQFSISGLLLGLETPEIGLGPFSRDVCHAFEDSSFVLLGRGGLLPARTQWLGVPRR